MTLQALAEGQDQPWVTLNSWRQALGHGEGAWSFLRPMVAEAVTPALSGATVTLSGIIPARAIVLGVLSKVTTAVTGAASFDVGDGTTAAKFGGSLGIAAGAVNSGVVGPYATYAAGDVVLTANGGAFTGGVVRVSVAYLLPGLLP